MVDYRDFDTVGDVIDYLSKFHRRTKVRSEYDGFCSKLSAASMGVAVESDIDVMNRPYDREYFIDDLSEAAFVAVVF